MPSCLPQSSEVSHEPVFDDTKYHNHPGLDMRNKNDCGTLLIDEQKRATQEAIMMQDLGSYIRDWITRSDFSRPPNVSLRQLQRDRAVEDPGSEASKAYMGNKKKINSWNNLHVELKNDGGAEELDTMMDGQSHRARLKETVVNTGGQRYDPHGSDDPPSQSFRSRPTRGGTASRGRGGGMVGTRGRGAPNSHRRNPLILDSVINRPLDPAIDLKDPRSKYRSGHGSAQRNRSSQQANQFTAIGDSTSKRGLGRGGKVQDVRATIVGTTDQVTATSSRPPHSRQLEPSSRLAFAASNVSHTPQKPTAVKSAPPARVLPILQDSDGILDPKRFLAVIAATADRERFNKMVPSQPKLALAPKAAQIAVTPSEKVQKTYTELLQLARKPAPRPRVAEAVANLYLSKKDSQKIMKEPEARKLALEKRVPEGKMDKISAIALTTAKNQESKAPTSEELMLEEITPANITRPKSNFEIAKAKTPNLAKPTRGEEEQCRGERNGIRQVHTHETVSPPQFCKSDRSFGEPEAWTDGVLTLQTPNFSASTENSPATGFAKVIGEGNASAAARALSITVGTATPAVGLDVSAQSSSAPEPRANIETDLLKLESEELVGYGSNFVSSAVADLMDLEFTNTPQECLTPCLPGHVQVQKVESSAPSKQHPLCVKIDGIRYFREDQMARAILPEEATGNKARIPVMSANLATTDGVITDNTCTIGVHHLGPQNSNLLGDRNLARRPKESSTPCDFDSIWADRPSEVTDRRMVRTGSRVLVGHQQKLGTLIQRNLSPDPRPSAIGQRDITGRSNLVPQDTPATSARGSPQAEDHDVTRPVQRCQGASMPRAANPWNTGRSVTSTTPKPSDLAESSWGQLNARDIKHLSQSRADEPSDTPTTALSFKTTTSSLLGDSAFSHDEALRSSRNDFRSYTSDDDDSSNVRPTRGIAEQRELSESLGVVRENSPVHETDAEKMVRMMRSQGSAGLTRLSVAHPANELCKGRRSDSSAGHSRGSSCSEGMTAKFATNLNISKWATEGTAISLTTIHPSARPAKILSRGHCAESFNTQFMRQEGKLRTTTVQTNARPGFALLTAKAAAASSDSPSTATTKCTASKVPAVESESGSASHTTAAQPPGNRNALARHTVTSETRVRTISQSQPCCQSAGPTEVQRGRGNFQNGNSNHNGSNSDESEL